MINLKKLLFINQGGAASALLNKFQALLCTTFRDHRWYTAVDFCRGESHIKQYFLYILRHKENFQKLHNLFEK